MMIHSIGLCNTFISQMFPYPASRNGCSRSSPRTSQDQAILANSWLQRTNHLWEPSLEHSFQKQQHGCFRFSHQPSPPKKNMSIGMRHVCFSMFFLCGKIFTYIITLFILDLHIDCGKKTRPGTNMSPLFYDVPFPKKRSQGGKGVSC